MAKIDIDGTEYETDDLSEDARRRLDDVAYCDRKLNELRREVATIQTARNAYARNLKRMLESESNTEPSES